MAKKAVKPESDPEENQEIQQTQDESAESKEASQSGEASSEDAPELATEKDIISVGKKKFQFEVAGFYLDGTKYLVKKILENPDKYKLEVTQLLAIKGQKILKEV